MPASPSDGSIRAYTEAERSAALHAYDILDTPREADFDELAQIAAQVCGTPIGVVNLVDTRRQFFKAEVGLGVRETPLETSFCGVALLAEDMMIVPDATKDGRFDCNPLVTGEPGLRFYAGALLKTPNGLPIGTMCVLDFEPRSLTDLQIQSLRLLAKQAMTQFELRRTLAQRDEALRTMAKTDRRRRDITRELSHRMKNVLAIVQAIVTQSLRTATTIEESREAISGRLAALARSQDILTVADMGASDIHEVVVTALAPHRTGEGRYELSGSRAEMTSQQATGLSLAVHELATNAAKYGALSNETGRVSISWTASPDHRFTFEWIETGGPPVAPPTRTGFGSRLIERIVAPYFDGTGRLHFEPEGVRFQLEGTLAVADGADQKADGTIVSS